MNEDLEKLRSLIEHINQVDIERRNCWIEHQGPLDHIHDLLRAPYQGIAWIDALLVKEDKKLVSGESVGFMGDLSQHFTQAYLWVLGAYEIVRTLSQFSDETKNSALSAHKNEIRVLKHKFELVRVPLAKFEAPRRNPNGYTFAWPIIDKQKGTGWLISEGVYITRRELSDEFLELMKKLR
jgi:hypothetical protein